MSDSSTDGTDSGADPGGARSAVSSIREIIERTLLVGLGAASLTIDRLQAVADEFVKRGQLSTEEGRQLVENLAARSKDEAKSALRTAESGLQSAYHELGLSTKREFEDMDFRMRQLEHRIALLEHTADGTGEPDAQV
jgi:polyhydroxyalkanoate synthesis regulator phasin